MFDHKMIAMIVQAILIVAAINWAAVAYNGTDLVRMVTGPGNPERYAKLAVGAVGVFAAYRFYMWVSGYKHAEEKH